MVKKTLIQVDEEAWKILNTRKKMGEDFSSVIKRMALETPEVKQ